jgi:hypothetical protein
MGLDMIEIAMGWEEAFGVSISDEEATTVRTARMAIDLMTKKLAVRETMQSACLTFRAFHRLRRAIAGTAGINHNCIRPESRIRDLVRKDRRRTWATVRKISGLPLPEPLFWIGNWSLPRTMADLTLSVVARSAKELKDAEAPWSRSEIRDVVRAVVTDVTGTRDYSDDDDFFKDIGLG